MVVGVLLFFLYMYYYMDHLHFHVLNAYANVGVSHAQHHVAHKYLNGEKTFVISFFLNGGGIFVFDVGEWGGNTWSEGPASNILLPVSCSTAS